MEGFDRFWQAWPSSPRKGAKINCKMKWVAKEFEAKADEIIKHVEWMKTTDTWQKQNGAFIPAPLVYLNQQRWDGAEIPEIKKPEDPLAKIEQDRMKAVPMPDHIREQLRKLRGMV